LTTCENSFLIFTEYEGKMKLKLVKDDSLSEADKVASFADSLLCFNSEKRTMTHWDLESVFLVSKTEYVTSEDIEFVGPRNHNYS